MNLTKLILSTVCYGAWLVAPAIAAADNDPAAFQADKDSHIAKILERIKIDQKNLSCVQSAEDQTTLNTCDETAKQDHSALEPKVEAAQDADKKIQKVVKNNKKK
jgi:predicted  nucleic acid-binding Zn-ribbon protein